MQFMRRTFWGGGTQNLIVGDSIRDRALIFIDAKYATTIEQPSTETKGGISYFGQSMGWINVK